MHCFALLLDPKTEMSRDGKFLYLMSALSDIFSHKNLLLSLHLDSHLDGDSPIVGLMPNATLRKLERKGKEIQYNTIT